MSSSQSLTTSNAGNHSKLSEEKQNLNRERDCLVLILAHLRAHGYISSSSALQLEGSVLLTQYETADNMDLLSLLKTCEDYNWAKFGRKPIFTRKICEVSNEKVLNAAKCRRAAASRRRILQQIQGDDPAQGSTVETTQRNVKTSYIDSKHTTLGPLGDGGIHLLSPSAEAFKSAVTGTSLNIHRGAAIYNSVKETEPFPAEAEDAQVIKPFPFGDDSELRNLAAALRRDVLLRSPGVRWEDVVELDHAKQLLQEAVIYPLKYPALFTGLLSPWSGILLYGPPGTGKTLLAKAVASQSCTTFFNISASSIVSKYRGDSEKLVRVLFELARFHAPSTIFLDEIDSLMGQRGGVEGGEHEGSRRMKTELFIQMDGLATGSERVFVLAASNLPWDLDVAMLRRLEKRIFINLPGKAARKSMLQMFLSQQHCPIKSGFEFDKIASDTEGYSGADIKLLCKDAAMRALRRILFELDKFPSSEASKYSMMSERQGFHLMNKQLITDYDMQNSLISCNPSSDLNNCGRYLEWMKNFGST